MELERRYIEKRDFSQARRGYDPDEVNRHLSAIALAVEQLKRAPAPPPPPQQQTSLAGAAAARVEAIVAAAEDSAREIEEKAHADAQAAREQAERDAAARVQGAEEMVTALVARAQELRQEVDDFVGRISGLKSAVDSVRGDFDAAAPAPGSLAAPPLELDRTDLGEGEPDVAPEPVPVEAAAPERAAAEDATQEVRGGGGEQGRANNEGARLIALNMALSGTPREETARYLHENFDLDDQEDLLDEVYARAGS